MGHTQRDATITEQLAADKKFNAIGVGRAPGNEGFGPARRDRADGLGTGVIQVGNVGGLEFAANVDTDHQLDLHCRSIGGGNRSRVRTWINRIRSANHGITEIFGAITAGQHQHAAAQGDDQCIKSRSFHSRS